jgi:hypothetical protein
MMEFSEESGAWGPVPKWVGFLVRLGYDWPAAQPRPRRIALVSMPCDSAAAGLLALGALVRDLTNPRANDIDGHYDRLLQYAQQYLTACRPCKTKCKPDLAKCGHARQATGQLRSPLLPRVSVELSDETDFEARQIVWVQRDGRRNQCLVRPIPQHTINYHIEGEPVVQVNGPDGTLPADPYCQLVPDALFHADNLRKSYSGLCLSGRTSGENASREICSSIRFRNGEAEFGLDDLLTIHGWSNCNVSRIAFLNTRTGQLDRSIGYTQLAVADGDASFLDAIDRPEFRKGDVVGVTHRIMERDRLEALGNKMSALRQWYVPDEDTLYGLPEVPRGISISILRRRT